MARSVTNTTPELDAPPEQWLDYWVKVRAQVKSWDFALSRHAMKEIRRLSKLVKPASS